MRNDIIIQLFTQRGQRQVDVCNYRAEVRLERNNDECNMRGGCVNMRTSCRREQATTTLFGLQEFRHSKPLVEI
jgi:hypothetical protein